MSSRKDQLKSLLLGLATEPAAAPEQKAGEPRIRQPAGEERAVSGSVKAMKVSLGQLGAAAEEAEALRSQLARGEAVVDLDPTLLAPSFVLDRLDGAGGDAATGDGEFAAFLADIRDHGQQSPVLVRPDPARAGAYQIAYGHRRWRAALALGRPVKAIVRALSDADLVVAQGQENARRRDLSFIEKALFARALDERGFDRATLVAALAVQTAEISRLLAVARAVPVEIARAIGSAPKAGRPRWLALADAVQDPAARARVMAALATPGLGDSDQRFNRAFAALAGPQPAGTTAAEVVLRNDRSEPLVRLTRRGSRSVLVLDEALAPELSSAVLAALPGIYAAWRDGKART